jgi:serine protease inhibitor
VDHPFLYFVGDRRTGLVVQMGRFVAASRNAATRRGGVE